MKLLRFALVVVVLSSVTTFAGQSPQEKEQQTAQPCPVTTPNGVFADGGEPHRDSHGSTKLSVGPFGLWSNGTVVFKPGGPGFVTPEGWLGMKFGWQRAVRGRLTVSGRRLDGPAPALLAESGGATETGFQATALIFPTPGCWEVTARAADATLTFVTKVEKIGDGPTWRRAYDPKHSIVASR